MALAVSPRRWRARLVVACILLGAVPAPAAQQPPPAEAPGAGAIGGVVFDGAAARPLAGAAVVLTSVTSGRPYSVHTITDPEGRFAFLDVPAGTRYVLRTGKSGYADGTLAQREARPGALSSLVSLAIAKGEAVTNANITMWPLGTISGIVVDERGEPVVNVRVRALLRLPVAGALHPVAGPIASTDDRGFYAITRLSQGSYVVAVMSVQATVPSSISPDALTGGRSGLISAFESAVDVGPWRLIVGNSPVLPPPVAGRRQVYPALFYPNARSLAGAAPLDVAPGQQRTGVDFVWQPAPATSVSGRLTGPPDAIANRLLRLLPEGSEGLGAGSEQATSIAGPTGEFAFIDVPAGAYTPRHAVGRERVHAGRGHRARRTRCRANARLRPAHAHEPGRIRWPGHRPRDTDADPRRPVWRQAAAHRRCRRSFWGHRTGAVIRHHQWFVRL